MALLSRLKRALGLEYTQPMIPPIPYGFPVVSFGPRRGTRDVLRAYREDGWIHVLVDTVAEAVATPAWRVYKPASPAQKKLATKFKSIELERDRRKALKDATAANQLVELPDHEFLRLMRRPSPDFTGRELLKLQMQHLLLPGEAYLWLRRADDGSVIGWEVIPPHCVTITPTPINPLFMFTYNQLTLKVPTSEMVWIKRLDPENPHDRGSGLGMALGDELDSREAIGKTVKSTMQRGGIPAAVIGVEGNEEADADIDERIEDLQKRYEESFKGPQNSGKAWFAPGKVSIAQVAVNFRELQLQEIDQQLRDYIRQTFNIPPELVGDLKSSNRSTSEEAKYTLAEYSTAPWLEFLRDQYQHKLLPLIDESAIIDFDDPRPQSWERTFKVFTTPPVPGVTWNEYRRFGGLPPDPELNGQRPAEMPGANKGGANLESAAANSSPDSQVTRSERE